MNAISTPNSNSNTKRVTLTAVIFAVMFWLAKRYNKTNKVLNFWPRSEKDISTFGVDYTFRACVSRDNRLHIRYGTWSIYVGQAGWVKTSK